MLENPYSHPVNLQYQLIKLAWNNYHCAPEKLDAVNLDKVKQQAKTAQQLITAVLESAAAVNQQVKAEEVIFIFEHMQQQFDSLGSFELCLKQQQLTEPQLKQAIYQDLLCEKTIASQSQHYRAASDQDALDYYQKNRDKFVHPERRKASHILITVNDQYAENKRPLALKKINKLRTLLLNNIGQFSALALQYSECPTALNKGLIGTVSRGQLYPQLDEALFDMQTNRISAIIESEIGFHLLLCQKIYPAGETNKVDALKEIVKQLNQYRQKQCEKKWLTGLLAAK